MPRLTNEEVSKRENFLRQVYKDNPDISIPKANEKMKEKFHSMMNAKRAYQLRSEVLGDAPAKKSEPKIRAEPQPRARARGSMPTASGSVGKLVLAVNATEDKLTFLEQVLTLLRNAGISNPQIENRTGNSAYLVQGD